VGVGSIAADAADKLKRTRRGEINDPANSNCFKGAFTLWYLFGKKYNISSCYIESWLDPALYEQERQSFEERYLSQ
jgi:hypothetical protein